MTRTTPTHSPLFARLVLATGIASAVLGAAPGYAATYTLSRITIPGATTTGVSGIARNGLFYGIYQASNGDTSTYTQHGGAQNTYDLGGSALADFRANSSGEIVGWEVVGSHGYRFAIRHGHFTQTFADYPPVVISLNDEGDWLGRSTNTRTGNFFGVRHVAGQGTKVVSAPGYNNTVVQGMNGTGSVIGYAYRAHATGSISFVYSGGQFTPIETPDGAQVSLAGINDAGALALTVDADTQAIQSYIDANGAFSPIAVPGATATIIMGLNDAGAAFGMFHGTDGQSHGFAYKAGAYTTFDPLPGATFNGSYLLGMDDAGDVVGVELRNGTPEPFYGACTGGGC